MKILNFYENVPSEHNLKGIGNIPFDMVWAKISCKVYRNLCPDDIEHLYYAIHLQLTRTFADW